MPLVLKPGAEERDREGAMKQQIERLESSNRIKEAEEGRRPHSKNCGFYCSGAQKYLAFLVGIYLPALNPLSRTKNCGLLFVQL